MALSSPCALRGTVSQETRYTYNNSRNSTTGISPNRLLFRFDYEIRIDIVDNVVERRIPAVRDRVEKLYQLR